MYGVWKVKGHRDRQGIAKIWSRGDTRGEELPTHTFQSLIVTHLSVLCSAWANVGHAFPKYWRMPRRPKAYTGFWPHFPILPSPSNAASQYVMDDWQCYSTTNLQPCRVNRYASPVRLSLSPATGSFTCSRCCDPEASLEALSRRFPILRSLVYGRASPTGHLFMVVLVRVKSHA
jgi:hypothetical protein